MSITKDEDAYNYIFNVGKTYWRVLKRLSPSTWARIYCSPEGHKDELYSYPLQGYYPWSADFKMMNSCIFTEYNPNTPLLTPVQRKIRLMEQRFKGRTHA